MFVSLFIQTLVVIVVCTAVGQIAYTICTKGKK